MNEATFEEYLGAALDRLFRGPLRARIEHQTQFTLRFGHHEVIVDGKRQLRAGGRLDILLSDGTTPVALLELKRPGNALTQDDEDQGWSYARLLDPMPPLYITTNGEDTRIRRTYDRAPLEGASIDEATLTAQIAAAAGAASGAQRDAIDFLLGHSPDVSRHLFQGVTESELDLLSGAVGDLTHPLADEFYIPRKATRSLHARLAAGQEVMVLLGRPLSGRTNVVAELCRTEPPTA